MKPLRRALRIFSLRRGERWPALVAALVFGLLNALMVAHLGGIDPPIGPYRDHVMSRFTLSGFDPYVDLILARWQFLYPLFRHPLFALFLYPFYLLNQLIITTTGHNCAALIGALLLVWLSTYSFVFLRRTMLLVGLRRGDATLLAGLFFSFASVMQAAIAPDHFAFTLFLLMITLWMAARCLSRRRQMPPWVVGVLAFLSAGVTLTNCVKVWLAALFANGRRCFRLRPIMVAVVLPAVLMVGIYQYLDQHYYQPERAYNQQQDSIRAEKDKKFAVRLKRTRLRERQRQRKQVAQSRLFQWTDKEQKRGRTIVENLFGESVQLHQEHLLEDVNKGRPVFVSYSHKAQYIVVALVVLLLLGGVVAGIRRPLMQLVLSWFLFDMLLHLGFGFAINEVSIMGAHWLFIVPIATGHLLLRLRGGWRMALRVLTAALALYLFVYNGWLIATFLT